MKVIQAGLVRTSGAYLSACWQQSDCRSSANVEPIRRASAAKEVAAIGTVRPLGRGARGCCDVQKIDELECFVLALGTSPVFNPQPKRNQWAFELLAEPRARRTTLPRVDDIVCNTRMTRSMCPIHDVKESQIPIRRSVSHDEANFSAAAEW